MFHIDKYKNEARALSKVYFKDLEEQIVNAVSLSDAFRYEWTYIPHFYHTPFYTYSYSFGNLLTISLYEKYAAEGKEFIAKYIDILSAGGPKNPEILLGKHGINITSEKLWQSGFEYVKGRIRELEKAA